MSEDLKQQLPQYHPALFRTAMRLTNDHIPDSEDLVQDTFVKALENLDKLKEPKTLAQWLYLILLRTFISQKRRSAREQKALARYAAEQSPVPTSVSLQDLVDALQALSQKQREAVLAVAFENLPYKELANKFGISMEALADRIHAARKNLRDW
jgi:RNA polymerase sigma-70 factor (ECF subfamily)